MPVGPAEQRIHNEFEKTSNRMLALHPAIMEEDLMLSLKAGREKYRKHNQLKDEEAAEDGVIHIGDVNVNPAPKAEPKADSAAPAAPISPLPSPPIAATSGLPAWATAAIAAGTLGAGGLGGALLNNAFQPPNPAISTPAGPNDSTLYDLRLVKPPLQKGK